MNRVAVTQVLKGLCTYLPGLRLPRRGTGGTDSARYCYSVWLRHLVLAHAHGLSPDPAVVAEIGPGDSIGMGLAALLTGAREYCAFDVVAHAASDRNHAVLAGLVPLLSARAAIPGEDEFPEARPRLDDYRFPSGILTDERLARALVEGRVESIGRSLDGEPGRDPGIRYVVPWQAGGVIEPGTVDMIVSQAVMEHVDDLRGAYRAMASWLRPGGCVSHQIDFRSHGTADGWNGHWRYSPLAWRVMRGRRPYLLNREPHSAHRRMIEEAGLTVLCDLVDRTESAVPRGGLAAPFRDLPDDDLTASGAYLLAVKR